MTFNPQTQNKWPCIPFSKGHKFATLNTQKSHSFSIIDENWTENAKTQDYKANKIQPKSLIFIFLKLKQGDIFMHIQLQSKFFFLLQHFSTKSKTHFQFYPTLSAELISIFNGAIRLLGLGKSCFTGWVRLRRVEPAESRTSGDSELSKWWARVRV